MKKKIIVFVALVFVLSCKEELPDYSFLEGSYDGSSINRNADLVRKRSYCNGSFMKLNVFNDNSVTIFIDCSYSYDEKYANKTLFDGYHVSKSRIDSTTITDGNQYYKKPVSYSLIDDKTDKEVGYFFKDITYNNRIVFISSLLVSSKKDSLFDYYGYLK